MPFVNTITNVKITAEKAEILKAKYGKAITLIPTKTEGGLMLSFVDDSNMYKAGIGQPCAFIELRIYGTSTKEAYNDYTVEMTKIMNEELGIEPGNVYINFMEFPIWGSGGRVF
jgi:Macrophage migration inhibitory factor (MIF).